MNENISHNFFIWEEKNSTEPQKNCENKNASETKDTTNDTQMNVENLHWKDITDPKLREKMRKKAYNEANKDKRKAKYEANKIEINAKKKAYRNVNKEKIKLQRKVSYQKNKEKIKEYYKLWYKSNIDERKSYEKSYYVINKDKRRIYEKKWKEINKDKIKENNKKYREKNKERLKNYHNSYCNRKFKTNIQFKLQSNLRSRLNATIKKNFKSGSAVKDLGCTIDELKKYLESKFQPGMTWDNWTKDGWHIDHIKPLASFDLSDRNQLLEACHYTNLQPLWAKDNLSKSDNII
jgi:hypothetical protein